MFRTRLISGIILVVLALFFIINGGYLLFGAALAISLIGLFELYRALKIEKTMPGILGYITLIIYYINLQFSFIDDITVLILIFLILLLAVMVFSYPKYHSRDIMAAFFGFFYSGVMLSFLYQTRMLEQGEYLVWLIFLCAWGSDTSAYCVGMACNKLIGHNHKMSPKLSPKKSIEGAIGGVVGAMLFTFIYAKIFSTKMGISTNEIILLAAFSAVGALISMVGDLAASAIKRNFDIKDYGKLIPGHGGIMDRFDSIIITAPIIYCLAYYFYL